LETDLANTTMTSFVLQTALDAETREHAALQSVTRAVCDALETQEGAQSGSSLRSRLTSLYGGVRERVRDALHTSIKWALAVMTSHYVSLNLQVISECFIDMPDPEQEKLVDTAEVPGTGLVARFEDEVISLLLTCEEVWVIVPV
jgi:hypothetical protein